MSEVRPVTPADIPAVANLFERVFRKRATPAPRALTAYMSELFISGPWADPAITSLVHQRPDGAISGFMGVVPLPLRWNDKPLRGAMCGTLMVDGREDDPLAGARLMRSFLSGPQDVSLSETASDVSAGMWTKLRGKALRDYSLDYLRILRPAGYLAAHARARTGLAAPLATLARPLDGMLQRRAQGREGKWWAYADGTDTFSDAPIDAADLAALIPGFVENFAIRPDWPAETLGRMLEDAARKPALGPLTQHVVRAPTGGVIGAFLYHGRPGGIAEVLQVFAAPKQAGAVLDRMFARANAAGMVAVAGRGQPHLLDALLGRKSFFTHRASTVVHARDPEIAAAFAGNGAFLNGLAGESWTRLIGDNFS